MTNPTPTLPSTIRVLNSLLQGERSAVTTYERARHHLEGEYGTELEANRTCHAKRVEVLTRRIQELGGVPTVHGGSWVGLTNAIEQMASIMGHSTVISALEQGEDIGLDDYKESLMKVDAISKEMILRDLLPAQERTHWRMSGIKQMAR